MCHSTRQLYDVLYALAQKAKHDFIIGSTLE